VCIIDTSGHPNDLNVPSQVRTGYKINDRLLSAEQLYSILGAHPAVNKRYVGEEIKRLRRFLSVNVYYRSDFTGIIAGILFTLSSSNSLCSVYNITDEILNAISFYL